jgi:hypothetical protein
MLGYCNNHVKTNKSYTLVKIAGMLYHSGIGK